MQIESRPFELQFQKALHANNLLVVEFRVCKQLDKRNIRQVFRAMRFSIYKSLLEFLEFHTLPAFRDGSISCRSGPLPLNHKAPPCSRNRVGAVGSTPSVRFSGLAFFFARKAASTRSGVNGTSCKRTPTAS